MRQSGDSGGELCNFNYFISGNASNIQRKSPSERLALRIFPVASYIFVVFPKKSFKYIID